MPNTDDSPIEIAERIYWVGHYLQDDRFQCHAYLIEHGDQSVLIDPGSVLTIEHTLRKVEKVIPFSKIRYFVCHHQDPDITGAMAVLDQMNQRDDSCVVTHWRAIALLRHLGLKLPFWEVSEHDWQLELGGRKLEFVFTPYLHFPGAITTFDRRTGTLFSSDLFGGFTDKDALFAQDMGCFDGIRAFHEHYMPSREILLSGMLRLEGLPLRLIAPQHGQIIPEQLIMPLIERLKGLDCGLYLLTQRDSRVERLLKLSDMLRAMLRTLHLERELGTIGPELLNVIQQTLPARSLDFLVADGARFSRLAPENRYRGTPFDPPQLLASAFGLNQAELKEHFGAEVYIEGATLALPLFSALTSTVQGFALIELSEQPPRDVELLRVLSQVAAPLAVAIERDALLRQLERERDTIYAQSLRDPLTELYTRRHMLEVVSRMMALHDRNEHAAFAVIVFDLDHFKAINDTHGHQAGDAVLKGVAAVLRSSTRASDIAVRYGGEELLVLADMPNQQEALCFAERLRASIADTPYVSPTGELHATASVGVALRQRGESFSDCLRRADAALYQAKHQGRNCVRGA